MTKPITKAEPTDDRLNHASVAVWETLSQSPPPPPFNPARGVAMFRSWVAAAATINAQAVASVPLRLYVKKRTGKKCLFNTRKLGRKRMAWLRGDAKQTPSNEVLRKSMAMGEMEEVVDDHPLTTLLANVNAFYNGFDFATFRILSQELTGNAYCLMIRSSDAMPPDELWPLLPQYTTIIPSRTDWISGYTYCRNGRDGVTFQPQDVIHFRQVSMNSVYYGQGKVEKAWGVINVNEANHTMDQALADNHARPDYAVLMEGGTSEQADQLQVALDRRLKGRHKAGKSLVLGGPKVTMMPLNFPPKDMGGRDDVVEEIAAVFGVPVSMLKANDPNLASSKTGYGQWRESTILPLCRLDEQTLNQQLVPLYSDDLMLAYDNPVPDDEVAELAERSAYVNLGIVSRNEARMEDGYAPSDDPMADRLLANGQPLGGYAPLPAAGPVVNVTGPAPAAPAAPAGPAPDAGIAAVERIAGADAERAVAMCDAVSAGTSNPTVVRIALVGMGFTEDQASAMIESAIAFKPQEASNDNGSDSTTGSGGDDLGGNGDSRTGDKAVGGADSGGAVAAAGDAAGHQAEGMAGKRNNQGAAKRDASSRSGEESRVDAISHKALMNGAVTLAGCCPHHKGEASDTVRDDEKDSPIAAMSRQMAAVFAKQRERIANAIAAEKSMRHKELTKPTIEELLGEFNSEIDQIIRPYLGTVTETGGKAGDAKLTSMGKPPGPDTYDPFTIHNPRVSEYLDNYTVKLRNEIQGYTGEAIAKYVKTGIEGGQTTAEMARGLREDASAAGGSMSPARSEMIARTESARGYVEGQRMAWQDSGVVEGKKWMLAPDACPFCEAMAAQFNSKSTPLDQPFMAKGSTLTAADGSVMQLDYSDVQGPPLHPHDRCDLEPVL